METRVTFHSSLALELRDCGIALITKFKKNMNNKLIEWSDRQLLRKRAVIESVIGQLKHICQIEVRPRVVLRRKTKGLPACTRTFEHSRHRSPINFVANLFAGLIAYCHLSKKRFSALGGFPDLKRLNQEAFDCDRSFCSVCFCLNRTHVN